MSETRTFDGLAERGLPVAPPAGMHDLLHPASQTRRALIDQLAQVYASHGYEFIITPPFEHAEVIERGLETVDRRDLLRFVEPETGEVALLRPDITPQIARVVATRLANRPGPYRLCYAGTLVRRRRGRARKQRQIMQSGVEYIGVPGPHADAEVIGLSAQALHGVGLQAFRIELGQVAIGREILTRVPMAAQSDIRDALARKDVSELKRLAQLAKLDTATRRVLVALPELFGDVRILQRATQLLNDPTFEAPLARLREVIHELEARGLGEREALGIDLGEIRGMSYYTGVSFTLLAQGPGEPVGGGGRYDNLLGQFGAPMPATGFGFDIDNLEWALSHQGRADVLERPLRVVMPYEERGPLTPVLETLRALGVQVSELPTSTRTKARERNAEAMRHAEAMRFAEAWDFDAVVSASTAKRGRGQAEVTIEAQRVAGDTSTRETLSLRAGDTSTRETLSLRAGDTSTRETLSLRAADPTEVCHALLSWLQGRVDDRPHRASATEGERAQPTRP